MIETPILSQLNHEKDSRYHASFVRAIDTLNKGLAEKEIWNVEINDAKFTLGNAVNRALEIIYSRWLDGKGRTNYEEWTNDLSSFCSFNQAAGRIKRLTKKAPKTPVVEEFLAAYQEVDSIWKAICELKPLIKKGRRPTQNKTEAQIAIELRQTGECAICLRRQKLENKTDKMVHHGYKMSDYNHSGYRMGKCFGTGYLPYELSNEANVAYAPVLARELKNYKAALKTLKSGTVETLTVIRRKYAANGLKEDVRVPLVKGTPEFDKEMGYQIDRTESFIRYTKSDIKANDARIAGWTLQPLKYGRYGDKA
jgi:hypothetical protein